MSQDFEFKPALLRGPRRFRLGSGTVSEQDDDGTMWEVPLIDLTEAAYVSQVVRGQRMMRLDLFARDRKERVSLNVADAGWRNDPDAQIFMSFVETLLRELQTEQPGFPVIVGEYGGGKLAMFIIGVLAMMSGIGIFGLAVATGVSGDKLVAGSVPMLLLTLFGIWIGYAYRPWQDTPVLQAGLVAEIVKSLATPSREAPDQPDNDRT